MALALRQTIVYHAGQTGGHWVKAVLRRAGLVQAESERLHDSPADLIAWPEIASRPYSLCFVRHPLTWIRSLWIHETQFGWTNEPLRPQNEFGSFPEYLEQLIARYPDGAASEYFAPFIEHVTLISRYESLKTDLSRMLLQLGEPLTGELPALGRINASPDDVVSDCAKAPEELLREFLETERRFCEQFHYSGIPAKCIGEKDSCRTAWFPVLPVRAKVETREDHLLPDNTFLFEDGSVWRGREEFRRPQLAIWDALRRTSQSPRRRFLELGCGDGYFVLLAEQLGFQDCCGIEDYSRATTKAARTLIGSRARFIDAPAFAPFEELGWDTILIREWLNHTPWPHLFLLNARRLLAEGGEILAACLIFEPEVDSGVCISTPCCGELYPASCSVIMSKAYLQNVIAECGLAVAGICSEYGEINHGKHAAEFERINATVPGAARLQRVVWRLRAAGSDADLDHLRAWLGGQTLKLLDCAPEDPRDAAFRTIRYLYESAVLAEKEKQMLQIAVHDREVDLARERVDAAIRNAELLDRTTRLEQALAELEALKDDQ